MKRAIILLLIICSVYGQAHSDGTAKTDAHPLALCIKKYEGGSMVSSEGVSLNLFLLDGQVMFADMHLCGSIGKIKIVIVSKNADEYILQFD